MWHLTIFPTGMFLHLLFSAGMAVTSSQHLFSSFTSFRTFIIVNEHLFCCYIVISKSWVQFTVSLYLKMLSFRWRSDFFSSVAACFPDTEPCSWRRKLPAAPAVSAALRLCPWSGREKCGEWHIVVWKQVISLHWLAFPSYDMEEEDRKKCVN